MSEKDGLIRLAKAIGYPQEVPAEAESFDFLVDGDAINVSCGAAGVRALPSATEGALLVFQTVLTEDEEVAGRLMMYAAGRLMKENAVLAWDPEKRAAILWERIEGFEGVEGFERFDGKLRRAFESFCESADWWRDRVRESGVQGSDSSKFLIRP